MMVNISFRSIYVVFLKLEVPKLSTLQMTTLMGLLGQFGFTYQIIQVKYARAHFQMFFIKK